MVSGSSDSNKDKRVEVLKLIQDKKDILFCNSIPTGDKNAVILDKHLAWQDVTTVAQSMGCYPIDKDWKYLRDTTWQNWRKRVIEKRDKIHAASAQQRNKIKYDYADLLILDIIGAKVHPSTPDGRMIKMETPFIKNEVSEGSGEENEFAENAYLDQQYQAQQYQEQYQDQKYTNQRYVEQSNQQYQEQQDESVEEYVEEEVLEEHEIDHQQIENADMDEECPDEPIISMTTEEDEVTPTYPVNYLQKLSQSVDANTSIPVPITVIRRSLNFAGSPGESSGSSGLQSIPSPKVPKMGFRSAKPTFLNSNNISIIRKRPFSYDLLPQQKEENLETLQKNKLRLEIKLCTEQMRLTERERYRMDLELLKLERELNLPPSKFTRNFVNLINRT